MSIIDPKGHHEKASTLSVPVAVSTTRRVEWADAAKGLSILGVCLMHIVTAAPEGTTTAPGVVSSILDPLRMPLFFMVSGLFAHRVLERTFGDLWHRRLWFLLIPYLVFTPIQAWIRLEIMDQASFGNLIRAIIIGDPGLWFLHALMLYNIFAWLLRKQPAIVAVALSTVPLMIGAMVGWVEQQGFRQAVIYAPIFFIGLHFRSLMFTIARRAFDPAMVLATVSVFVLFEVFLRYAQANFFDGWDLVIISKISLLGLVRTLTAIPFGIVLAVWLTYVPGVNRMLLFIGANTLPIYVSHHAMMALFFDVLTPKLIEMDANRWGNLYDTYPRMIVGLLACLIAGTIFYWIGKTPVLKWILYPPALPGAKRHVQKKVTSSAGVASEKKMANATINVAQSADDRTSYSTDR